MKNARFIKPAGVAGMFGAVLWVVALFIEYSYDLFGPREGALYAANQVMFLVGMLCFLAVIAGLMRAGAAGSGRFGRISLGIFFFGWAMLVATILPDVLGVSPTSGTPVVDLMVLVGAIASTLGGLLAGIAVAAAGRLRGWTRFAPLGEGLYQFVQFLRVVLTDHEPTQLTESLWMVTWFLMGLALFVSAKNARPAARSEAREPVEA